METLKSNSLTLIHRDKNYTLNDLENILKKKTAEEIKIIAARKHGLSIGQMNETELRYVSDQVITKGSAIYGCDMPQTDFFASIISKELTDFLLEFGYENLTLNEILLSMKMNADGNLKNSLGEDLSQIVFSGKFIHISFLSKVLKNYKVLRNNLERKFQNQLDGY